MSYFESWTIEQKEKQSGLFGPIKIVNNGYISGDARREIAVVNAVNPLRMENARMLAAAPQLLTAANDALAVLLSVQQEQPGRNVDVDHAIRLLIGAIARAKESEK